MPWNLLFLSETLLECPSRESGKGSIQHSSISHMRHQLPTCCPTEGQEPELPVPARGQGQVAARAPDSGLDQVSLVGL
jgi:hypothetical protein